MEILNRAVRWAVLAGAFILALSLIIVHTRLFWIIASIAALAYVLSIPAVSELVENAVGAANVFLKQYGG